MALVQIRHQKLPQEMWDNVSRYLSPFGLLKSSRIFRYRLTRNQKNHCRIWSSIFKDDKWLTEAEKKFKIDPVLISPNMDHIPTYMVLALRDKTGDLWRSKNDLKDFLRALQDHDDPDLERQEITFKSGIVLNVHDIFVSQPIISVEPTRLFEGKRRKTIRTQYMLWNDPERKLRKAKACDFAGPYNDRGEREKVGKTTNQSFCCEMSLAGPGKNAFTLWFQKQ